MMFEQKNLIVGFIILIVQFYAISTLDDGNDGFVSLNFEDNIDGKFSSFSKINVQLSRQTEAELTPSRTISSGQFDRLVDFRSDYPYYTLKVHFKRGTIQDYVMTSIPMCLVLQTQFRYTVTLYVNENGYVVSAQTNTGNSTCSLPHLSEIEKKSEYNYKVSMRFQLNEIGPQPDTQRFLEKLKRQQEAKLNAQEADNRPFILKYWKYIVPVVIIMVLQSAFTQDAGGPGAGGGNGGG
ncbi:unnamed protein product [Adineta ricciae]|uniref:ER membrane protein complex subunit 10 n=1 Tax=Adineta ricciae TaxID=249248 RepID=A0A815WJI9_ADIRI|nr:unnamed protein product [Adineta ricciae]CAF1549759.1 unnamed protein product [Adineta ricciae]